MARRMWLNLLLLNITGLSTRQEDLDHWRLNYNCKLFERDLPLVLVEPPSYTNTPQSVFCFGALDPLIHAALTTLINLLSMAQTGAV